jgi:ribonuclease III
LLKSLQKLRFKSNKDKKLADSLYLLLGFYPKNIFLYKQALRHSSASKEINQGVRDSNARLEYLGDAILGSIIAEYLFQMYPFKGEGFLTQMRSRIVNRSQLNQLAVKLGINQHIKSDLKGSRAGSMHGDAFEALIGAIYLDRGYAKTRKFVVDRILKIHLDINEIEQTDTDYKSKLINICQKQKKKVIFHLLEEVGKGHTKEFVMQVEIDGKAISKSQHTSKRKAEQNAAELALEKVEQR